MTSTTIQTQQTTRAPKRKLSVGLARSEWDILEAQRLRYRLA